VGVGIKRGCGRTDGRTRGRTDGQTRGRTDGRTRGRTDGISETQFIDLVHGKFQLEFQALAENEL
jgi:hypothetical protein